MANVKVLQSKKPWHIGRKFGRLQRKYILVRKHLYLTKYVHFTHWSLPVWGEIN